MRASATYFALLAAVVTAGCTASWQLAGGLNPLGGGVREQEIEHGIYYIVSGSNNTYVKESETARRLWQQSAEKVCASAGYREVEVTESVHRPQPKETTLFIPGTEGSAIPIAVSGPPLKSGSKHGFAVCNWVTLTDREILVKIGKLVE